MSKMKTEETQVVETTVSVGNSDIVDMFLVSFLAKNKTERDTLQEKITSLQKEQFSLMERIFQDLCEDNLKVHQETWDKFTEGYEALTGEVLKVYPSTKAAYADLDPSRSHLFEDKWRTWVHGHETVLELAGIKKRRTSRGELIPWVGVPKFVDISPVIAEVLDLGSSNHRTRFHITTLWDKFRVSNNGACSVHAKSELFETLIDKKYHESIFKVRELEIEIRKLKSKLANLKTIADSREDLRIKISAQLTKSLLEEAGLSVDIEKVWKSMPMTIEKAMTIALEDKLNEEKRIQNKNDDPNFKY